MGVRFFTRIKKGIRLICWEEKVTRAKGKREFRKFTHGGLGHCQRQVLGLNGSMARILFLGDIVGRAGREAVCTQLTAIRSTEAVDLVVVNGENAAGGSGLNSGIARDLLAAGADGITLGDHCWDQRGFDKEIDELEKVSRPLNLYPGCPGPGYLILEAEGFRLCVVTLLGQQLMKISSQPAFPMIGPFLEEMRTRCDAFLVEMHAETTSEKVAMGWYLDGRVSAVLGTHTHIPTADVRRLSRGTGYITDAGMCGPYDSVLGRDIAPVLGRFLDGMPRKFTVAEANVQLRGVLVEVEAGARGCRSVEAFAWDPLEGSRLGA